MEPDPNWQRAHKKETEHLSSDRSHSNGLLVRNGVLVIGKLKTGQMFQSKLAKVVRMLKVISNPFCPSNESFMGKRT